jgi:hypothetical protein
MRSTEEKADEFNANFRKRTKEMTTEKTKQCALFVKRKNKRQKKHLKHIKKDLIYKLEDE